jgi:hypothetical protein
MRKANSKCTVCHSNTRTSLQINISDKAILKDGSFEMHHTWHSKERTKKRGISDKHLANLLGFGSCYEKQGLQYYVLSNKEIRSENLDLEINDSLVAVVKDDIILTTYYTSKLSGHKHISKKSKRLTKVASN